MSKENKQNKQTISVQLPQTLVNQIDQLIKNGQYVSRSDFMRNAVRKQLEEK